MEVKKYFSDNRVLRTAALTGGVLIAGGPIVGSNNMHTADRDSYASFGHEVAGYLASSEIVRTNSYGEVIYDVNKISDVSGFSPTGSEELVTRQANQVAEDFYNAKQTVGPVQIPISRGLTPWTMIFSGLLMEAGTGVLALNKMMRQETKRTLSLGHSANKNTPHRK